LPHSSFDGNPDSNPVDAVCVQLPFSMSFS
jgi:hypothetical protein